MNNKLYTQKQVAEILGMSLISVMKWVKSGRVNVVYLPTSKRPLITQEELDRLRTPVTERP
jgi:predicted site-specific integrase-resolvase